MAAIHPTRIPSEKAQVEAMHHRVLAQPHNQGQRGAALLGFASIEIARNIFFTRPGGSWSRFRQARTALAEAQAAGDLRHVADLEEQLPALKREAETVLRAQIDDLRDQWREQNPGRPEALTAEQWPAFYALLE